MGDRLERLRPLGRVAFALVVLLSLVVLFTPGSYVPQGFDLSDKLIHSGLFVLLALTGLLAGVAAAPLLVLLVAYAGLSEVLQAVLPIHRDGDVLDALADSTGAVLGVLLGLLLARRLRPGRSADGAGAGRPPRPRPRR